MRNWVKTQWTSTSNRRTIVHLKDILRTFTQKVGGNF